MRGELENLFNPKSIAVIGASREENKVGGTIFRNLLKNKNLKVFPVNPNAPEILKQKTYADILEIPYDIDLAIIATPAKTVPAILRQIEKKKVKNVIITSAGFAEAQDKEMEKRLEEISKNTKMNILGPNTFGVANTKNGINTTFYSGEIKSGGISFISQSGAIASATFNLGKKISKFVSIGNQLQLQFKDFIEYFSEDKDTEIIGLYIESLKENSGKEFIEVCKKCKKPIIALKSGKTEKGKDAAKSHTASLATDENIYAAAFKQAGVKEVNSLEELFLLAETYEKIGEKIENLKDKKICIVTNAGGFGVLTADHCGKNNLQVVDIPENIKDKLKKVLPTSASSKNPIDMIGDADAERYKQTLDIIKKENFYDILIVIQTPQEMTEQEKTAEIIEKIDSEIDKPILACFIEKNEKLTGIFKTIPNFTDPEIMCRILGKI